MTMKKIWCDHFYLSNDGKKWAFCKYECYKCSEVMVMEAFDNWKFCPVCGAHRPQENKE